MARMRSDFGQRMHDARKKAGLTQGEVAGTLGIGQSTIGVIETTANSSQHTPALAKLYGVDPYYLATGKTGNLASPAKTRELTTKLSIQLPPGAQNPYTRALPWGRLGDYMRMPRREDTCPVGLVHLYCPKARERLTASMAATARIFFMTGLP